MSVKSLKTHSNQEKSASSLALVWTKYNVNVFFVWCSSLSLRFHTALFASEPEFLTWI